MNIDKVMNPDVKTITADTSLLDAARIMRDEDIGFLVIADNDEIVGTMTDRDIVMRAVSEGLDVRSSTVKEIMTTELIYCNQNNTVDEVAERMNEAQVQRVPIMSDNKELAGIVSIGDLAQHTSPQVVGQAMRGITESAD